VTLHIACGAPALAQLAAGAAVLDADEQARAARFRLDADREAYSAAHVLLRQALSQEAAAPPAHWRFRRGAHGRPEIDTAACPDAGALRFNLSHTRGLVCCALTRHQPLGVDAECARALRDAQAIAERFFTADEAAAIAAAGPPGSDAQALAFRAVWTLKEAYVKAHGLGLAMGLASFGFRLVGAAPARIRLRRAAVGHRGPPAAHWRCLLLHLDGRRCALAAAVPAAGGARFRVLLHGADAEPEVELAACTPGTVLLPVERVTDRARSP
jgi:4'-phosphopantetheinyl transferase